MNSHHPGPEPSKGLWRLVALQGILLVVIILVGKPHTLLHNMDWPIPTASQVAAFDFVGRDAGKLPSIWAVILETAAWSFLGVMARAEYRLARTARSGAADFSALRAVSQLFGDAAAGISIAVALVALIWSSELKFLDFKIALKDAGIGSIIAVAFILGFFHDKTQALLRKSQERLLGVSRKNDKGSEQKNDADADAD
jgi:hypothetical protein